MTTASTLFSYRQPKWFETNNGAAAVGVAFMLASLLVFVGLERMGWISSAFANAWAPTVASLGGIIGALPFMVWLGVRYTNERTDAIVARLTALDKATLIALAASPQVRKDDRECVILVLNQRYSGWDLDLSKIGVTSTHA